MGRSLTLLLASLLLASLSLQAQPDTLTIIHVGDSHSRLSPWGPRNDSLVAPYGGIARLATVVGVIRATESNVIALHSGDLFIGDLFFNRYFGVPELRLLGQFGFDAMTLGNHEFDLTPAVLKLALDSGLAGGGPAILSANCDAAGLAATGLAVHVRPFTIVERAGHKVGIFGMTTPLANVISQPQPIVIDTLVPQIATLMVDTLKKLGCDVVIMLSHLGADVDRILATYYVPGINVIIAGHDHLVFAQPEAVTNPSGQQTVIANVGALYGRVGEMKLVIDSAGVVSMVEAVQIPLDQSIPEEPTVKAIVDGLIAGIEETYGPLYTQQLAVCEEDIEEAVKDPKAYGWQDTPFGNIVTDAFRQATGAQLAMQPGGNIADKLYKGPIVPADVFRAIGYGFNTVNGLGYRVAKVTMTGADILAGLEFGASQTETNDEYLVQVSGMRYSYDPMSASPRLRSVELDSVPFDPQANYTVAVNDFTMAFLAYLGIPFSDVEFLPESMTEFQVVAAYVTGQTLRPLREGRVIAGFSGAPRVGPADDSRSLTVAPVPSSAGVTIQVRSERPGRARIEVYDALGRLVAVPYEGYSVDGALTVPFDSGQLSAGSYTVAARIAGDVQTRGLRVVR